MFYDADAHWHPDPEIFKSLPAAYYQRVKNNTTRFDIDGYWKTLYDQVKDESWPEPGPIEEFYKLPDHIRKELREVHQFPLVSVSDDLTSLHIDHWYNHYPTTETQKDTLLCFVKAQKQLLNPPVRIFRMTYTEDPGIAVDVMATYNRELLGLCDSTKEFDGNLWLALQDVDASIEELDRNIDKDFFGVFLSDKPSFPFIKDMYPLFERCAKHKIPLYFHFQDDEDPPLHWQMDYDNPNYQRLKNHFYFLGDTWPILVLGFITEGLLDRWPDLRIVFAERTMSNVAAARQGMIDMGFPDPLPYFKKNFWFTIDVEEPGMIEIAREIGWDRMMFGTDYPHNNDVGGKNRYHDVDMINDLLSQGVITPEDHAWISHKNYQRLKDRA